MQRGIVSALTPLAPSLTSGLNHMWGEKTREKETIEGISQTPNSSYDNEQIKKSLVPRCWHYPGKKRFLIGNDIGMPLYESVPCD